GVLGRGAELRETFDPSCPAKAGHPVTRAAGLRSQPSRITGSPAFAEDDSTALWPHRLLRIQVMTEIRVPTLGESVTEATIGRWFKKAGDAVAVDEPLVELETDKVTIEVPAPSAGTLGEIVAKDGETVAVGALLGQIMDGGGGAKPAAAPAKEPVKEAPKPAPAPAVAAAAPVAAKAMLSDGPLAPSVRKISAESGIDASTVPGSGKDGRVTKGDMLAAIEKAASSPTPVGQLAAAVQMRAPSPA